MRRTTLTVITHVWALNEIIIVARTIYDKTPDWSGNRNAIEETDGVSNVTDIVHLSMQEVLPAIVMSCLNTIGMRGLGSDGHDSQVA